MKSFPEFLIFQDPYGFASQANLEDTVLNQYNIWRHSYSSILKLQSAGVRTPELPIFKIRYPKLYNFVFCDTPRRKWITPWKFSIFAEPFDIWTWLALLSLLFLISLLVLISSRRDFHTMLLSAVAALLENEMSHISNSCNPFKC